MKTKLLLPLVMLASMTACSTISEIYTDYPKQVATLQASLAAAEHTALIYVSLPACGKTTAVVCRSPDITIKIGTYDSLAFQAVEAAKMAEDQTKLQLAIDAVKKLSDVTDVLTVTK